MPALVGPGPCDGCEIDVFIVIGSLFLFGLRGMACSVDNHFLVESDLKKKKKDPSCSLSSFCPPLPPCFLLV